MLCGLVATAAAALILISCRGAAGQTGATGAQGPAGPGGPSGPGGNPGVPGVVDAALYTPEQWEVLAPKAQITGVTMGGAPVVNFRLTDAAGYGIKGLGGFTSKSSTAVLTSYPNLSFALAKLVPAANGSPSKWVSYIVTTAPSTTTASAPGRPTTDNTGTLVDNGDGTYRYTFWRNVTTVPTTLAGMTVVAPADKADLGNVAYEPTLVHRLTLQFSGAARGTGSNTPNGVTVASSVNMKNPVNLIYDFIPATGAMVAPGTDIKDVVSIGKCNECHTKLAFHGGGARVEARYCVVCHTDQRKYGYAEAAAGTTTTYTGETRKINGGAAGDMTAMAHRIHMGTELTKTGYLYAGLAFEKMGYSMLGGGQRMCIKCHQGVPQADNWKTKPSRLACGTCHDSVNWSTGEHHEGGPAIADNNCASCHTAADVSTYHMGENLTAHNPAVPAGLANFTYEISSATQSTAGGPVDIKFRIMRSTDGSAAAPITLLPAAAGMANPLTGFTGSPGFLLSWALPQDGVATPADYNNLLPSGLPVASNFQPVSVSIANLLNTSLVPSRGTLTGPDSSGYYTAQIASAYAFPVGAKLRAVGLQGYFTQISPAYARHAISVIRTVTGDTTRRTSVDPAKCANCHEWFEGHGGNRVYTVQLCVQCHLPGLTTSGKGISDTELSTYYNAGLFTERNKTSLTAWTGLSFATNPVTAGNTNVALKFPQVTNNMKDMIHGIHAGKDRTTNTFKIVRNRTPSAINVIDGALIGYPGGLNNCTTCHTYNGYSGVPANTLASRDEAINVAGNTTTALAKSALATPNAGDLMTTPFTAACASCHDSAPAAAHMKINGGQILVPRTTVNAAGESCAVCHGAGADFDPVKVHK
jgi:OmcA/MtrC family decaheme c-type cytochrome